MKQVLLYLKSGEIKVEDVPIPALKPGGVVVSSRYSVISGGTELSTINLAKASYLGKAKMKPDLFNKMGWINRVLELVAYLVVAVSAGAILASIYNTINERRREFAILRALGARRATVFSAIVAESAVIAGLGALFGFLVYGAILGAATYVVRQQTGVVLDALAFHPVFVLTPLGMIALGALAGVVPATKAYVTDVADNLIPQT